MDSEVGEDITQQIGAVEEATDAVRRAIFSSRRRRTIGYE
jgi:DNA-binding FrmR family transcriptional regulator